MKQRVLHYDVLSGIMLLFMIHHHLCGSCGLNGTLIHTIPYYILYFYISYFFFKAGIFYSPDRSWKQVCLDSARRLLIPFVIFTAIGYVLYGSTDSINTVQYWWHPIRQVFAIGRVEGNGPLWFLLSLFLVRVIFQSARDRLWMQIVLAFAGAIVGIVGNYYGIRPRTISNVAMGLFFYGIGYWMRDIQYVRQVGWSAVGVWLILYVLMLIGGWHVVDFSLNNIVVGSHPIWLINCVVACLAANFLLSNYSWQSSPLAWMGRNSMVFLCVHALIYEGLHTYVYPHTSLTSFQMLGVDWISVLVMCSLFVYVFKNRYLCWMIGEKAIC